MKKFELKNKAFKVTIAVLTLSTISVEAAHRPSTNTGVQQAPLQNEQKIKTALTELYQYSEHLKQLTTAFFNKRDNRTCDAHLEDAQKALLEIKAIWDKYRDETNPAFQSINNICKDLVEMQTLWITKAAKKSRIELQTLSNPKVVRWIRITDGYNGLKAKLSSAHPDTLKELHLFYDNADYVFNFDKKENLGYADLYSRLGHRFSK